MKLWRRSLCVAYTAARGLRERRFYEAWIRSIDSKDGPELCIPDFCGGRMWFPPVQRMGLEDWKAAWEVVHG